MLEVEVAKETAVEVREMVAAVKAATAVAEMARVEMGGATAEVVASQGYQPARRAAVQVVGGGN